MSRRESAVPRVVMGCQDTVMAASLSQPDKHARKLRKGGSGQQHCTSYHAEEQRSSKKQKCNPYMHNY
eukprot:1138407-Pelagomonas_calceolata.AAC.1